MTQPFDFDKALKALQEGQALTGKDGTLTPLIKQLTEAGVMLISGVRGFGEGGVSC